MIFEQARASYWAKLASWILMGAGLLFVLHLKLFSALLSGLVVYELVHLLAPFLQRRLTGRRAGMIAIGTLATTTIAALILIILSSIALFRSDAGNPRIFVQKLEHILTEGRSKLPGWITDNMPGSVGDLKTAAEDWYDEHSKEIQQLGKAAGRLFVHILIGMVIGALLSLQDERPKSPLQPFPAALLERTRKFSQCFQRIISAQVRISILNTILTGLFLLVLLPIFGVHLPLAKTLVAVTFICGLLPVVGNLISNTLIVVVGLSISVYTFVAALVFLIVIHKLEYFLNARIVGTKINARAWELLLAMITMEAAFGISGLIAAPLYYAYLKAELMDENVI
ncbi:MAG: AI-2E family transporter [Verrucomicrobia bacterium]|nr:AI-2E family transporter [Verrucomicrobiota bacterium]